MTVSVQPMAMWSLRSLQSYLLKSDILKPLKMMLSMLLEGLCVGAVSTSAPPTGRKRDAGRPFDADSELC